MFLQQARQLLPQRAFFLVGHCHRWYICAWPVRLGKSAANYRVFHKRRSSLRKIDANQRFAPVCRSAKAECTVALVMSLR